jgi:hypothetical protein
LSANQGFDHLFSNDVAAARTAFGATGTPFRLLGLGVCVFLAAAGQEGGAHVGGDAATHPQRGRRKKICKGLFC